MMTELLGTSKQGTANDFLNLLGQITFIDVGTIVGYSLSTNKADVLTYQVDTNGKRLQITDVEVMLPGSVANGFRHELINTACLVFYPKSVVPSLRDKKIMMRENAYSVQGAKCLPFSVIQDPGLRIGFDGLGNFTMNGKGYSVTFTEESVAFSNKSGSVQFEIGEESDIDTILGSRMHLNVTSDGAFTIYYTDDNDLVSYKAAYQLDGTYTVYRGERTADEEDFTWTIAWGADKSLSITQINSDGDTLNNISVSAEGDVTIAQTKAENTIELKQDGTFTVTTKSDVKVNSSGNVEIMAGDGKKLKAGGNSKSLKNILIDDLLGTLLSAFDSVGSPGSTSTGPNATQTIMQFKQSWAEILD